MHNECRPSTKWKRCEQWTQCTVHMHMHTHSMLSHCMANRNKNGTEKRRKKRIKDRSKKKNTKWTWVIQKLDNITSTLFASRRYKIDLNPLLLSTSVLCTFSIFFILLFILLLSLFLFDICFPSHHISFQSCLYSHIIKWSFATTTKTPLFVLLAFAHRISIFLSSFTFFVCV